MAGNGSGEWLVVDCGSCVMRNTDACDGCLVSFVLDREPDDAIVFDAAQERALRSLTAGGLLPDVRYRSQAG